MSRATTAACGDRGCGRSATTNRSCHLFTSAVVFPSNFTVGRCPAPPITLRYLTGVVSSNEWPTAISETEIELSAVDPSEHRLNRHFRVLRVHPEKRVRHRRSGTATLRSSVRDKLTVERRLRCRFS